MGNIKSNELREGKNKNKNTCSISCFTKRCSHCMEGKKSSDIKYYESSQKTWCSWCQEEWEDNEERGETLANDEQIVSDRKMDTRNREKKH